MDTTHTELGEGERNDVTVTLVSRRVVTAGGELVRRLLVEDRAGERFALLVTPGVDPLVDGEPGATYRIRGVLGCSPVAPGAVEADCPACGGPLRPGSVADTAGQSVARAAATLGLDAPFGVVDTAASVTRVREDADRVDDWVPMDESRDRGVAPPDFVCEDCDRHVDAFELRTPDRHRADAAPVDASLANASLDTTMESQAAPAPAETVGMATGGAKDVTTFRENVREGFTPQPEAISDEGLFYDYHFETGERADTDALFAPRYATAVSDHPVSGETERYLSVGLDSTLSLAEFERPRLDLVAVLDVSGSMDSPFDAYYYDEHGRKREAEDAAETKLAAATRSLCALTEQLREDDRLGVVLYNHRAHVAKPLRDVGATDMAAIRRHISDVAAGGSTNLEDGFAAAVDMLADGATDARVERRVVFMTDMMPNTGETGESALTRQFADAAADGVHTTFVGMGLDANAALADTLSGIRGANHYFVHSAAEFERRLGDEFDYMVTPLVYDLALDLEAEGYEIEAVHGSPSADAATDRLLHVGTLFPSPKRDGEARGGVVLVRLRETGAATGSLDLVASWTERGGRDHAERVTVEVPDEQGYAHDGVRKAVALARYARELRAWAGDVHRRADRSTGVDDWLLPDQGGRHERESVPLVVPDEYATRFATLREYLAAEREALGDETLARELDLLADLGASADRPLPTEVTD